MAVDNVGLKIRLLGTSSSVVTLKFYFLFFLSHILGEQEMTSWSMMQAAPQSCEVRQSASGLGWCWTREIITKVSFTLKNPVSKDLYIRDGQDFSIQIPTVVEEQAYLYLDVYAGQLQAFAASLSSLQSCYLIILGEQVLYSTHHVPRISAIFILKAWMKSWGHLKM